MSARIPHIVQQHLYKAKESALLAVEVYNKPSVAFKSFGYISLMIIAWTAIFHAAFFKRRKKPYYRENRGRQIKYKTRDGEYSHWELSECLKQYYGTDTNNPVRKNLELFIPLRNKIEHRHLPEFDTHIFAECQCMLLNFNEFVEREFGEQHSIRESLSFSLQMFPRLENYEETLKRRKDVEEVINFVTQYRSMLSTEVNESGKYAFKAYLIRVANHQSQDALPIQFVNYNDLPENVRQDLQQAFVAIKVKEGNQSEPPELFLPGQVMAMVRERLGNPQVRRDGKMRDKYYDNLHHLCFKRYNVRPKNSSSTPEKTNSKYCVYDRLNNNYGYTMAWVEFLVEKLSDEEEYQRIIGKQTVTATSEVSIAEVVEVTVPPAAFLQIPEADETMQETNSAEGETTGEIESGKDTLEGMI